MRHWTVAEANQALKAEAEVWQDFIRDRPEFSLETDLAEIEDRLHLKLKFKGNHERQLTAAIYIDGDDYDPTEIMDMGGDLRKPESSIAVDLIVGHHYGIEVERDENLKPVMIMADVLVSGMTWQEPTKPGQQPYQKRTVIGGWVAGYDREALEKEIIRLLA